MTTLIVGAENNMSGFTCCDTFTLPVEILHDKCDPIPKNNPDEFVVRRTTVRELGLPAQPNPFANETKLSVLLPTAGEAFLSAYDVQGRLVDQIFRGEYLDSGLYIIGWRPTDIPSGIYCIGLRSNSGMRSIKVMFAK